MTKRDWGMWASWLTLFAGPLLFDKSVDNYHAGLTFSETTRAVTGTIPHGKTVFSVLWAGGTLWFWVHIVGNRNTQGQW